MTYGLRFPIAVVGILCAGSAVASASVERFNPRPLSIPAVRQWTGARGTLRLGVQPRILVAGRDWDRLKATASVLAGDLGALARHRVRVVHAEPQVMVRRGDVVLALRRPDHKLGIEGYTLAVGTAATIAASSPAGVFYGTRTLLQLLHQHRALPRGMVRDWPRYPVRGLMIDLGRRGYPASWIEAEIERLAYLKMNILHLHLTDDQRWGLQSDTHPEVVSPHALSKREVEQILTVARRYHVTVVPEIDMPGHLGALLAKHPELALKPATTPSSSRAPESRLDITNPAALAVVRRLLDEYLPLFPGRYWDVGGDEYLTPQQAPLYPQLAAFAIRRYGPHATTQDAIIGFLNWVDEIVRHHHKILWAWHDELGGGSALVANADIEAGWWTDISPLSQPRPLTPLQLLAAGHNLVNEGWFPTYYTEDVGPIQGKPIMQKAYENWDVNRFCSPTVNDQLITPCHVVSPNQPQNLGSTINAWDDHELTLAQLAHGLTPPLMVLAQKTWHSPELTASYRAFEQIMTAVGDAPGA